MMETICNIPVKIENLIAEDVSNSSEKDIQSPMCFIKEEMLDLILETDVNSGDSCVTEVTFNVQEPTYLITEGIDTKGEGQEKLDVENENSEFFNATYKNRDKNRNALNKQSSTERIECNVCLKTFPYNRFLKHVMVHTGERPHVCRVCGRGFRLGRDLKQHTFTHTGEKPYTCTVCGKKFADASARRKHYQTHTGEKPYSCEICQRAFTQISHLREHHVTHTKEKLHNCEICGKHFTTKSSMQRHTLTHTNCCDICGESFTTNIKLERHKEMHNMDRPHSCPYCPKRFLKKADANTHLLSHSDERNVICKICKGSFKSARYLRVHHYHYHKGMELPFVCIVCKKGFFQEAGLYRHSFVHVLKRRVKCPDCLKTLPSYLGLEEHVCETSIHYFKCPSCEKKYRYKSDLTKHIRKFHASNIKVEKLD